MPNAPRSPCSPTKNSRTTSCTVRGCSASSTSASTCSSRRTLDLFQRHGQRSPECLALQAHGDVRRVVRVPDHNVRSARPALRLYSHRVESAGIGLERLAPFHLHPHVNRLAAIVHGEYIAHPRLQLERSDVEDP